MLTYFPPPYFGELLFSVISRLAEVIQYPRSNDLFWTLYGQDRLMVSAGLPNQIDDLAVAFPTGYILTADKLIHEGTLYPFYQPFLLAQTAQTLKALICGRDGSKVPGFTGLSLKSIWPSSWLCFCYDCVQTDRTQYGEYYWHQLHQLPGVKIFPQHRVIMQDTQVPIYHRTVRYRYILAEQALTQRRHSSIGYLVSWTYLKRVWSVNAMASSAKLDQYHKYILVIFIVKWFLKLTKNTAQTVINFGVTPPQRL